MRIAILGGGTAGFVAAVHLTSKFPQAELLHIFDSRIPTIGVGEGTTPRFPVWLKDVTGLEFDDLAAICGATLKRGSRFEGWGRTGDEFLSRFQPTRLIGYHFDAARVCGLLAEHVNGQHIDARVEALNTHPDGVTVHLEDGSRICCNYVLDARGFPPSTKNGGAAKDIIWMDWIPTGRAMLRRLQPGGLADYSRIIARPHGWIFQLPLIEWTSCGYVFHPDISADSDVATDFTEFLHGEGITDWETRGSLSFPNFMRRTMFDGRVFWVGNSASFVEPLEATAIGAAVSQVRAAQTWIEAYPDGGGNPANAEALNRSLRADVLRNSLFIAWHYSCGSRWDTPYWRFAAESLDRANANPEAAAHLADMDPFIEAGREIPGSAIATAEDADWDREVLPLLKLHVPYGNFSELNFAQVGHGIGFYGITPEPVAVAGAKPRGQP